jgi:hypothetical protein
MNAQLTVSDEERVLLTRLLELEERELPAEIHRATPLHRADLRHRLELVERLLSELRGAVASTGTTGS